VPVFVDNDAKALALGEGWVGAAAGCDNYIAMVVSTGVGGGIVLNGRLWHGMNGMANELGHFNVESEGHPCGCGSRGCLEQYASATAIVRMAHEEIASGNAPDLADSARGDVEFSSRGIYQLAIQGHPSAKRIYERVGRALAIGVSSIINALNLPMYVIGGGVSSAWEAFAPTMFQELKVRSFIYSITAPDRVEKGQKHTVVTIALMGSDAGLYGAARLPMLAPAAQTEAVRSSTPS